jgi:hypothetical protein
MKIVELLNKISIPLTNEEWDVLSKFTHNDIILKRELSDREQLIATSLVKKNVLLRKTNEAGKIVYSKKIK